MAPSCNSDREQEPMPSLTAATPSPTTTPIRSNSLKRGETSKSRRKRISPQDTTDDAPKSDLFGDYMSIEELAAQTEKAYGSRTKKSPIPSPMRSVMTSSPRRKSVGNGNLSPKVSPRRRLKKSDSTGSLSTRSSADGKKNVVVGGRGSGLAALFVITIVLPFLVCESLLLVLTWRYHGEMSLREAQTERDLDIRGESSSSSSSPTDFDGPIDDNEAVDSEYNESDSIEDSVNDELDVHEDAIDEEGATPVPTNNQDNQEIDTIAETATEDHHKEPQLEEQLDEPETPLAITKQQIIRENHQLLQEARTLIATARSLSKWEMIEQTTSAEILCRTVSFRAKEMGLMLAENDAETSDDHDEVMGLYFKSNLCIGGAKISMSVKDVSGMLAEAKQVFEHLSTIDPYSFEAQAGLGTSILAQGILYDVNNSTALEEQTSLLATATFHLKLASSLCSTQHKPVDIPVEDLLAADEGDIKSLDQNQPNQIAHAAILHNLALAYIALGDSNSSTPLLLRAAAMKRQFDPSEQNVQLWNLPNQVLQLLEEKAWLLGAKSSVAGRKQQKKRRIPFVPEEFSLDEMVDGM